MRVQINVVASSLLSHLAYDPEEQRLFAQFKSNGAWYVYEGVPERHFQDVMESASVGKAFGVYIKGGEFLYRKVEIFTPEGEPDIISSYNLPGRKTDD